MPGFLDLLTAWPSFHFVRSVFRLFNCIERVTVQSNVNLTQQWDTSSTGHSADTSPMELSNLGEQLSKCQELRGRLFTLHCVADSLHRFLLAHFVSSLVLVALFIVLGALAI